MALPDPLQPLKDALLVSPTNVPLRLHLADAMIAAAKADEAEGLLKDGLARTPTDARLKVALAKVYLALGKFSAGVVVCEDALRSHDAPGEAKVLLAKLLHQNGETARAVSEYKAAVEDDEDLTDAEFEARLGIGAENVDRSAFDGMLREAVGGGMPTETSPGEIERPKIGFADVGGMEGIKEEIRLKIIYPLTHADLFKAYGKTVGGGVLLYGPPGCGKTHLARATAGEVKAGFVSVGLHDVLDMWVGNSEKQLHDLFQKARRNNPCVLFFDEVDALAASRADFRQSTSRLVINQFLNELDGVTASNEGVLVLAATNAPWHMDSAFRRPGRFDRILFVPPPDQPGRAAILRLQLVGKPQKDVDFDAVAKATHEFSGADLKAVVDRAIEAKLTDAMKTGIPSPLSTRDLVTAAGIQKPSTREWFADARNYAMYANDGGLYDDLAKYLKVR
jgi:AAA+ superfamily predicted ATPase